MKRTEYLNATDAASSEGAIARAAEILRAGGIVAFPTETVYGLGADARSEQAVQSVFQAKERPGTNPLIVHLPDAEMAKQYAAQWPEEAQRLAEAFWPGPLTLVVPAGKDICPAVLAGGETLGLRVPSHPVALALLKACNLPLAAPSANRSNSLSPTTAQAVLDTLDGRIDAVLDGGPCHVGIESTVLDLTVEPLSILRPGGVSAQDVERILGKSVTYSGAAPDPENGIRRSPGQFPRHYAPAIPLVLSQEPTADQHAEDFLICFGDTHEQRENSITLPADPRETARLLYATLRHAERSGAQRILMQLPPDSPEWDAIRDRLRRAGQKLA